jgi:hypothetical protein
MKPLDSIVSVGDRTISEEIKKKKRKVLGLGLSRLAQGRVSGWPF